MERIPGPKDSTLKISALSRTLHLGALYDARRDRLIPGISLWSADDMKSKTQVSPQPRTEFQVETSESLSEKTNLLGMSASVKLSFLSGLITAGGSAKYLDKKTSSALQCRVTLKYQITTDFKELMICELGAPSPESFDKTDATHVVIGVLYGADAFMEFQETASDASSKRDIVGNLTGMIKKIPSIQISGDGSLAMDDEDKDKVKNFNGRFYGDFRLENVPSTFEEAVKVCKNLPSLLGENGEKAVPVQVWLYPLSKLNNTESKLRTMISDLLVSAVEKVMDDFHQAEIRTNDLLKRSREIKTEEIITKLQKFQSRLRDFKAQFLQNMAELIPAIRGGQREQMALRDLLKSQDASGFNGKDMKKWLDEKETEINFVSMNINKLKSEIKPCGPELDCFLMCPDVPDALVFNFTSLMDEEPYLNKISQAAENFKSGSTVSTLDHGPTEEVPWYRRPDVREALNSMHGVYKDSTIPKVISFNPDSEHPGASIHWYQHGTLKDPHVTCSTIAQLSTTPQQSIPDAFRLTLDPNTAHRCLLLSEGNRKVARVIEEQPYPDHPDRFDGHQVLSREPLTGHCSWECEWSGKMADIGVAYKSIRRKGLQKAELQSQWIGATDRAWCLKCTSERYSVWHQGTRTDIAAPPRGSRRVKVYVEREVGTLSFYSVSADTRTHLYTFHTTFTDEPLHAAFWVETDATVALV
ncbi:stonustoxin subunit beta-like [Sardina pilchardus]|uniref:stonustoxin subunit beta-like n=1 Tax=Sardina pilchardus TaxID=27697 RepID=UPI002E0EBA8F